MALPSKSPPYLFSDTIFTPNHKLAQLKEMGITEMAATKALNWTGVVTPALSWPVTGSLRELRIV